MNTLRLICLGALTALSAFAQSKRPPLPTESRQFDFWLGEWSVTNPAGQAAGESRIESIAGGAGLLENWTGAKSDTGRSLNAWNPGRKQWQQFWVGSGGGVLELAGGLVDNSMVLTGEHDVRGQRLTEKITWTPNSDGSVRQHWEQSADGGKSWKTVFDGLYRKTSKS
jgi:hypothetical protein